MSFTQNTAAQSRALTAFFDTKGAARKAVSDIEAAGVPRGDVAMVEGEAGTAGVVSTSTHDGFLASLKDILMPEEDRYSYAEGLRRGGYLVLVKTGKVDMDRLLDMTRLAGESRVVMRARHPWTVFETNRTMPVYDNRRFAQWHTLEGPFVRQHNGKYYCFYSGANFLTDRYGVDERARILITVKNGAWDLVK